MSDEFTLKTTEFEARLKKYAKQFPVQTKRAMEVAALQFLTWANVGSSRTSRTPPIKTGVLRGSSSAFVGNKFIGIYAPSTPPAGQITPAYNNNGSPDLSMTWIWNTSYAAKMHEWKGGWGKTTKEAKDAGNQWATAHLRHDRRALFEIIAKSLREYMR